MHIIHTTSSSVLTFTGQIRARSPSSTSVNSDDTLDEDVRRILNKYSKVITSSEDESEVNEARKSPQGEISC